LQLPACGRCAPVRAIFSFILLPEIPLTLSLRTSIKAAEIESVVMYKELKVFRIDGYPEGMAPARSIVIKGEGVTGQRVQHATVAARAIDPLAAVVPVNPLEIAELKRFATDYVGLSHLLQGSPLKTLHTDTSLKAAQTLLAALNAQGNTWVKMESLKVTSLMGALENAADGDKTALRAFTKALTDGGGLEALGRIVAADLFNANGDRIGVSTGVYKTMIGDGRDGKPPAKHIFELSLKVVQNVGNLMIVAANPQQEKMKLSMLDYVEPGFNELADINMPLADAEKARDQLLPIRVLADKKTRKEFAGDIVDDLEMLLNPRQKRGFFSSRRLGMNARSRMDSGLLDGCKLILKRLEGCMPTPGVNDRIELLRQILKS
jgi:hypothetical protein